MMFSLLSFQNAFSQQIPKVVSSTDIKRAAVAIILSPKKEMFMIRRATVAGDPWSGHMAFPGGRFEQTDKNLRETAERETFEEVGVDLRATTTFLGRLNDLEHPKLIVSAYVYWLNEMVSFTLDPKEVAQLYSFPLEQLVEQGNRTTIQRTFAGTNYTFPAIHLLDAEIWGISLQFIDDLLHKIEA